MNKCKDCIFWAPEDHPGWGFCEGWLSDTAKFDLIDTRDATLLSEYVELETKEDFGCNAFQDKVEEWDSGDDY